MIPFRSRKRHGFALIIVLAFVTLITVVVLAFFSQSILQRKIGSNSANGGKVELFARGALDTTVGDFQQEIVAGSNPTTVTGGAVTHTLYWPITPATMVPFRVGTTDTLPNLVKASSRNQPFYPSAPYTATGPSRAAASSTATSSRPLTVALWNAPCLLPLATTGQTGQNVNLTPISDFTAPDWIYVDVNGNNPTAVSADIVGRYAYCVYDEGGLLDANVAGYPAEMTASQAAHKLGSSFADLTQLFPPKSPSSALTAAQIDALVGWRNYASAQPSGNFPSYQFGATSVLNYFNTVFADPWGFMRSANKVLYNGQSDQKFSSRQQLIRFLTQAPVNASSDVLQYLGTFSRSLDQPSYRPDPNRPVVLANAASYNVTANTGNSYTASGLFPSPGAGGNDAFSLDSQVNPFFPSVVVGGTFTRNDGTTAIAGEPLVKKRFGLSRLCWITYKGPLASLSADDPIVAGYLAQGISQQLIDLGTTANIQAYFGLTWNASTSSWTYGHGVAGKIGKLSDVQALGTREPDFFELLKAALDTGSLGKASAMTHITNAPDSSDIGQYWLDTTTDFQVLQIGADIIDQFDADSYPTHLQFAATAKTVDIYGIESLPYLYRTRSIGINLNTTATVTIPWGYGAEMLLPEVWNPNDPTSPAGNPAPTNFRFLVAGVSSSKTPGVSAESSSDFWYRVVTTNPNGTSTTTQPLGTARGTLGVQVPLDSQPSVATPTGSTELDFTIPNGSTADRQPFFVGGLRGSTQTSAISMHAGPSNYVFNSKFTAAPYSPVVDPNGYVTDAVSSLGYCGVVIGTFGQNPKSITSGVPALLAPFPTTQPAATSSYAPEWWSTLNPSSPDACEIPTTTPVDYLLQYQDSSGNWVTYQDKVGSLPGSANMSVAKTGGSSTSTPTYLDISKNSETGGWQTWMDPRTSRFGSFDESYVRTNFVSTAGYYSVTDRPDAGYGSASTGATPGTGLGVSGALSNFSPPGAGPGIGWYPGGWSYSSSDTFFPAYYGDNNADVTRPAVGATPSSPVYFTDPDGVVRRGMSGYAGTNPGPGPVGLPQATLPNGTPSSRPYILNRPFRSVAELGYVFSGTPWRNLDFSTVESGASPLLDIFCINETADAKALVAGKVNLNTRQVPVLQALLSGSGTGNLGAAYKDETNAGTTGATAELSSTEITQIAQALVTRTTSPAANMGPLENVADLVGRWNSSVAAPLGGVDGSQSYAGFANDLTTIFNSTDPSLSSSNIPRLRESAVRALSAGGQTRVWNLLIDLVAQTGKYGAGETSLDNLLVDGERRYWLHVAIDRLTGKVIDEQLEQVNQ